jgi:ribonuclease G
VVDEIETNLRYLISSQNEKKLTIITHPYVYAYLTKGLKSIRLQWMIKYRLRLTCKASESYGLLDYKFFNAMGDEIAM